MQSPAAGQPCASQPGPIGPALAQPGPDLLIGGQLLLRAEMLPQLHCNYAGDQGSTLSTKGGATGSITHQKTQGWVATACNEAPRHILLPRNKAAVRSSNLRSDGPPPSRPLNQQRPNHRVLPDLEWDRVPGWTGKQRSANLKATRTIPEC